MDAETRKKKAAEHKSVAIFSLVVALLVWGFIGLSLLAGMFWDDMLISAFMLLFVAVVQWRNANELMRFRPGVARAKKQRNAMFGLVMFLAMGLVNSVLIFMFGESDVEGGNTFWYLIIFAFLFLLLLWLIRDFTKDAKEKDCLEMYERDRGKCGRCGYDLSQCLESECPECGWERPRNRVVGEGTE